MGVIKKLISVMSRKPESEPIEITKDGETFYKEDIIAKISDELEKRKSERVGFELQWTLNSNFLLGNQYCDIKSYSGDIEQVEPLHTWISREVFNKIAPLIETRRAHLGKVTYSMKVNPATNEVDDYAKAEVSTSLLRHLQNSSGFSSQIDTAILWNELCGNCFFLSWWNSLAGEEVVKDEFGNPLHEGDIDYGLLTPYEIFPESIFKQGIENQRSIIIEQVKSAEEIHDLYGVEVKGTTVNTFELTPIPSGGGLGYESTVMSVGHREATDSERVITYFEKPSRKRPHGLMAIIIGDEHLIYYGDLPYDRYPIVQMVCREVAGQFFGRSVIEDLIPLQRSYNSIENSIIDFTKRAALGNILAEEGSIDLEKYEEEGLAPGAILEYEQGSPKPDFNVNCSLPNEILAERHNLVSDMEYVAGVSQLMVTGSAPSGITSGTAISNLMEIDNTRLSLTAENIRNAVKNLAVVWLGIYKKYAKAERALKTSGKNDMGNVLMWSGGDINSYDVEYTTENELLESEDVQRQRFLEAYNMGLFTNENGVIPERFKKKAIECMKANTYGDVMSIGTLQIQSAQRENAFFSEGVLPEASEFDDHDIHMDEHLRYILQMDFKILKKRKPDYAKAMEEHYKAHEAAKKQKEQLSLPQMPLNQ